LVNRRNFLFSSSFVADLFVVPFAVSLLARPGAHLWNGAKRFFFSPANELVFVRASFFITSTLDSISAKALLESRLSAPGVVAVGRHEDSLFLLTTPPGFRSPPSPLQVDVDLENVKISLANRKLRQTFTLLTCSFHCRIPPTLHFWMLSSL